MNRNKERLMNGYCDVDGDRIYFYGKVSSVSVTQALYYIVCDMQKCFKTNEYLEPVLKSTTVFNSSMWLARKNSPPYIKYFKDEERRHNIYIDRSVVSFNGSLYRE